jgi:hypothetical protein
MLVAAAIKDKGEWASQIRHLQHVCLKKANGNASLACSRPRFFQGYLGNIHSRDIKSVLCQEDGIRSCTATEFQCSAWVDAGFFQNTLEFSAGPAGVPGLFTLAKSFVPLGGQVGSSCHFSVLPVTAMDHLASYASEQPDLAWRESGARTSLFIFQPFAGSLSTGVVYLRLLKTAPPPYNRPIRRADDARDVSRFAASISRNPEKVLWVAGSLRHVASTTCPRETAPDKERGVAGVELKNIANPHLSKAVTRPEDDNEGLRCPKMPHQVLKVFLSD